MTNLPAGWGIATVEELAGAKGLVTDGDWIESKDQDPDGNVRLIQLADIGDGDFRDRSSRFVTEETARRLRCTYLEPGDMLVARMPDPLGRACIFPGLARPAITAVDVLVWRGQEGGVVARWLMHAINSPVVRDTIADQAGGTTRQRISGGRLKQLTLRVPPVAEQRRMVAKIDSLSSKSVRARDKLDHIPRLVEKYKQAVLAAAFRGDLTREWRAVHGGSAAYRTASLSEALTDIRYGTAKKCAHKGGATPVLRIPNVQRGEIILDDLKFADFDEGELRKLRLRSGDLLVIRSNGSLGLVGRSAIVSDAAVGMLFAGYLIRLRLNVEIASPNYVHLWLQSSEMRTIIERLAKSTSGVNNINSAQIEQLPIRLTGPEEQREIVRRIDAAFAWIDRLAKEASSARKLVDHLDQAVLAKAFRGELVPQDPNDEPATALLERIKAERTNVGVPGRRSSAK